MDHTNYMTYDPAKGGYKELSFNHEIVTTRTNFTRFSDLPIPKGSVINSATYALPVSAKNKANAQSFVYNVRLEDNASSPVLLLDQNLFSRTFTILTSSPTFNWVANGADRQYIFVDAKTALQNMVNKTGWSEHSPLTFLTDFGAVTSGQQMFVQSSLDGTSRPSITVNWTPPASTTQTVPNLLENPNFTVGTKFWEFNSYYGTYTQTNYNTTGLVTPPKAGLAVQCTSTGGRPMIAPNGLKDLQAGKWYTFTAYVYVPSATTASVRLRNLVEATDGTLVTQKNQWVRVRMASLAHDAFPLFAIGATGTVPAGQVFYVANACMTEGDLDRPYIDGNQTLSNAVYRWGSASGVSSVTAKRPNTTAPARQPDNLFSKAKVLNWTNSHPDGMAIVSNRVEW